MAIHEQRLTRTGSNAAATEAEALPSSMPDWQAAGEHLKKTRLDPHSAEGRLQGDRL